MMARNKQKTCKEINDIYLQVLKLVKSGMTIQNACEAVNIERGRLRTSITEKQRQELKAHKAMAGYINVYSRIEGRCFVTLDADNQIEE